MTSKRLLLVCGGVLLLAIFGFVWGRGGGDFSDGDRAVANVGALKKGMTMSRVIQVLHPERTRQAIQMSYGYRPDAHGSYEMLHALAPTRYLVLTYTPGKVKATRPEPLLEEWSLIDGKAPRDDVTIGREFQLGSFRIRY